MDSFETGQVCEGESSKSRELKSSQVTESVNLGDSGHSPPIDANPGDSGHSPPIDANSGDIGKFSKPKAYGKRKLNRKKGKLTLSRINSMI